MVVISLMDATVSKGARQCRQNDPGLSMPQQNGRQMEVTRC